MKLSFSTLPCMDYSAYELKDLCDKYGFYGAEVRANADNTFVSGNSLKITNVGSSLCISCYDENKLAAAADLLSEIEKQDITAIRVFLGSFRNRLDSPQKPIDHSGIVQMLQKMCEMTNREIWIETHNEYSTGKVLSKLINDIDKDNLKIIWDIIHPIEDGESPEDTIRYLGGRIAHIHIKDGKKRSDPMWHDYEYTPLGQGELPIAKIVNLLEKRNFSGCYSLEWESPHRDELNNLGWSIDKILQTYKDFMEYAISE